MSLKNALKVLGGDAAEHAQLVQDIQEHPEESAALLYEKFAGVMAPRYDYPKIAKSVVVAAALHPHRQKQLVEGLASPPGRIGNLPLGYARGIVLGLFQVGVWLDTSEGLRNLREPFAELLPACLPRFLSIRTDGAHAYRVGSTEKKHAEAFEQELSRVIKLYVRGGWGARRAMAMLRLLEELQSLIGPQTSPTRLTRLVVDQLCYAYFGSIATEGRLAALLAIEQSLTGGRTTVQS